MLFAMIVGTLPCKAWKLENQYWTKRTGPQTSCLAGIFQRDEDGYGGVTVNNFRPSCTYEVAYTAALPMHQRARSHKVRMRALWIVQVKVAYYATSIARFFPGLFLNYARFWKLCYFFLNCAFQIRNKKPSTHYIFIVNCNGSKTEWSPIRSVDKQIGLPSEFVMTRIITDWIGRHEVSLLMNRKNYNFREKKNTQVINEKGNCLKRLTKGA